MPDPKTYLGLKAKDIAIAYVLLRVLIGVNYFNHGFTRIFDVSGFVEKTVTNLANSYFPEFLVRLNAYLVPPVELIVGILITIGFATRSALIATFVLMIILMMGVTSIQNWGAAQTMLVYGLVLFILLAGSGFNIFSVDYLMQQRTRATSEEPIEQGISQWISRFWPKRRPKRLSARMR